MMITHIGAVLRLETVNEEPFKNLRNLLSDVSSLLLSIVPTATAQIAYGLTMELVVPFSAGLA
jgi:hypothetical protein